MLDFIRLNKKVIATLFRTAMLKELSIAAYGYYSALISAEFLLIEEGTTDRVLYRTAGSLVNYSEQFYSAVPTVVAETRLETIPVM